MSDQFGEVTLAFKRYAAQVAVDEEIAMGDVDLSVQHMVFGQVLFQLRAKILSDDLPPEQFTARDRVPFEVPASTWQMWKKRHARRWYARRLVPQWPVRYEADPDGRGQDAVCTFNLERWRAYPRARVQVPEDRFGAPVLFHAIRELRWNLDEEQP